MTSNTLFTLLLTAQSGLFCSVCNNANTLPNLTAESTPKSGKIHLEVTELNTASASDKIGRSWQNNYDYSNDNENDNNNDYSNDNDAPQNRRRGIV